MGKERPMPRNPVQFVQNDEAFLQAPDRGQKGEEKDFFEDRDTDFAAHKTALLASLDIIEQTIVRAGHGPATYIRVTMREAALAKSYRPNRELLTPDRYPCVGAGAIGELFFFLPAIYIPELKARIARAQSTVPVQIAKSGRRYRATTRLRSEIGAIERIEIVSAADKRVFSAEAAVQSFLRPTAFPGYLVELFEVPPLQTIASDTTGRRELFGSLFRTLLDLGNGSRSYLLPTVGRTPILELQITRSSAAPALVDLSQIEVKSSDLSAAIPDVDPNVDRHEACLRRLAAHPLVRRIDPPVELSVHEEAGSPTGSADAFPIPVRVAQRQYPKIGVIDSGIGAPLAGWTLGRFDHLQPDDVDVSHGTKVAAIVVAGQGANGPSIAPENDGCDVFDLALFPKLPFNFVYKAGFTDFLEEVEQAVREAKEEHGIRIFNMSINCLTAVQRHSYSTLAARLDAIADRHGVLIVNSAGNLKHDEVRNPWARTPRENLAYFAARTLPDTVCQPTETVRGLSIGALNCPDGPQLPEAPARYSRRGPGLQVGVKPDLVHYGGCGPLRENDPTGLKSADADGATVNVCGTSYAAPLVARTLAELDLLTEQSRATHTLRALTLHHAEIPALLKLRGLKDLARQFAGFGRPPAAIEMLETDDHQITIVFESQLTIGNTKPAIMRFAFEWPAALADPATGGCSGNIRMTLVYDPPLDPAFGAEFARVNLDASLKQRQPDLKDDGSPRRRDGQPSFADQISMIGLPKSVRLPLRERALIDHGLKWWPSKRYEAKFDQRGISPSWRLEVTSVTRAEASFPTDGVPFCVVLTIEDPSGSKPIFQTFRQYLQTRGTRIGDIRTAQRLRQRQ
jgi:subtilisin family serine protease